MKRFNSVGAMSGYYRTAVCGSESPHRAAESNDRLIMVSSLQIIWLEILLALYVGRRTVLGSVIIPMMLIQYALITRLCPAIVRSCLQLFVQKTAWDEKWGWPPIYTSTASGLLALILFPRFAVSIGFLIGWIAATSARSIRSSAWRPWVLLLMLYPVFLWNLNSPAAIVEWVARPLLLAALIPPCFAVLVFPVLHRLVDPLWWGYEYFTRTLIQAFGTTEAGGHPSPVFLWLYLVATLVFGIWVTHRTRRREVFTCANS